MASDSDTSFRNQLPMGCGLGAIIGSVVGFVQIVLIGRSWAACDVGINASANGFGLVFFYLPILWVVNTAVFGVAFAAVRRERGRESATVATLAGLLALGIVGMIMATTVAAPPAGYPTTC